MDVAGPTPVVRQTHMETDNTDMNEHLDMIIRKHNREVARWVFVYGMLSKQQRTEFQEWNREQLELGIDLSVLHAHQKCMTPVVQHESIMNKQSGAAPTRSTDINEQLIGFNAEHNDEVAKWTFVDGMLSEPQRKEFQEWKAEQRNLELNQLMSDDSSDEEGTDDDDGSDTD